MADRPPSEQTFENAVIDLLVEIRNALVRDPNNELTYKVINGRWVIEAATPQATFQAGTGHNP